MKTLEQLAREAGTSGRYWMQHAVGKVYVGADGRILGHISSGIGIGVHAHSGEEFIGSYIDESSAQIAVEKHAAAIREAKGKA